MLAAWRIVAALEAHDKIVRVGGLGGGDNLFLARSRPTHCNVVAHRTLEQEILLRDITDLLTQRGEADGRDVLAVAEDLPRPGLVESQDEVHHRRFSPARAADQRRRLARFRDEANGVQDWLSGPIAKHHVAKFDSAVRDLKLGRLGRVLLVVALVEEAVEHADAEQRRRQVDMQPRHPLHRLIEHDHRSDKGKEAPGWIATKNDGVAAVKDDGGYGEAAETLHDRARTRAHASELVRRLPEALDRAALPLAHEILEGERLNDANALRGLLHRFHHLRGALELARHDRAHANADLAHPDHAEWNQHQRQERKQRILRHHDD